MIYEDFLSLMLSYEASLANVDMEDLYKRCFHEDCFRAPENLCTKIVEIIQSIHEYHKMSFVLLQQLLLDRHHVHVKTKSECIRVLILRQYPLDDVKLSSVIECPPPINYITDLYNHEKKAKINHDLLPIILKYDRMSLSELRQQYSDLTGTMTFLVNRSHLIAYLTVLSFDTDLSVQEVQEKWKMQEIMKLEKPFADLRVENATQSLKKPIKEINSSITNLQDLIDLGEQYHPDYDYYFDMKLLHDVVPVLRKVNSFIGLQDVKAQLVDQLLYFLQFEKKFEYMHTVLTGPPGVGKTEFAKVLGELYLAMGILKNNIFKKVVRSDLIAGFVGQTAIKTRDAVRSCLGGVMFIDEVYSLGSDSQVSTSNGNGFSKECIDTLNELLSEEKDNFICIVAGYKDEIEKCFFSFNQGLSSRFPIRFDLKPYNVTELYHIFLVKVNLIGWKMSDDVTVRCFDANYVVNGRDVENFLSLVRRCHSKRVFTLHPDHKKTITKDDIHQAFTFLRQEKHREENEHSTHNLSYQLMYL